MLPTSKKILKEENESSSGYSIRELLENRQTFAQTQPDSIINLIANPGQTNVCQFRNHYFLGT